MKKIKFTCPSCQAKLRVPTHLAGVTAPCPKCGAKITAPTDFENFIEEEPKPRGPAYPTQPLVQGTVPDSASPAAWAEVDHANENTVVDSELVNKLTTPPLDTSVASSKNDNLPPEPPAVAKTQPIKINPLPDLLPSLREAEDPVPGDLPRLDTSLAGEGENAAETLTRDNESEPTKLVLTMSGEMGEQVTPADFLLSKPALGDGQKEIAQDMDDLPDDNFQQTADEAESNKDSGSAEAFEGDEPEPEPESESESESEPQAEILDPLVEIAALMGEAGEEPQTDEPEPAISMDDLPVSDEAPSISIDELDAIEPLNRGRSVDQIVDEYLETNFGSLDQETQIQDDELFALEPSAESIGSTETDISSELGFEAALSGASDENASAEARDETEAQFDEFLSGVDISPKSSDVKAKLDLGDLPTAGADLKNPILDNLSETAKEEDNTTPTLPSEAASGSVILESDEPQSEASPKPKKSFISLKFPLRTPKKSLSDVVVPAGKKAGFDGFDEMFAPSSVDEKGTGPSRTSVIVLSGIGAVIIISVLVVVVLIRALGGLEVASPEPDVEPLPAAITDEPKLSGSSTADTSPEVDSIDGDAPLSPNSPAKVTELPVQEAAVGSHSSNAVTSGEGSDSEELVDVPAKSFEERVLSIVNGDPNSTDLGNGSQFKTPPTEVVNSAASQFGISSDDTPPQGEPLVGEGNDAGLPAVTEPAAEPVTEPAAEPVTEPVTEPAPAASAPVSNYNPENSFPVPLADSASPLGRTHDLLDAFLRAPDWESRVKYTYQGESLRPLISEYYEKWPFTQSGRFSKELYQMESSENNGGPFWVYLISTDDYDSGFPLFIRAEDGLLKVDWEIFAEFSDGHFVKFLAGDIPSPHTLRVVINRVTDYYGPDRETFPDLDQYYVYKVKPPYGGEHEFSTDAFVRKDSPIAAQFEEVVGLNDDALAVIVTMESKPFAHGINHYVITDFVTEGWFR